MNCEKISEKKLLLLIIILLLVLSFVSGCSINTMIEESYLEKEVVKDVTNIDIDEGEIKSVKMIDEEMRKDYDVKTDVGLIKSDIKNPFKPFYVDEEELEEKNVLKLDKIYSEDGVKFIEIYFNNYLYKLKEGDAFASYYQVKAINPTSVVLLKGDEIITIFINKVYYD